MTKIKQEPLIDTSEWRSVAQVLKDNHFNDLSLQRIQAVMVDGQSLSEVAEETGTTRQGISILLKRARTIVQPMIDQSGLKPVMVWIPYDDHDDFAEAVQSLGGKVSSR